MVCRRIPFCVRMVWGKLIPDHLRRFKRSQRFTGNDFQIR
ncbi:hypothetical protein OEM_32630 [Mycobacterium intracellulare subsp. yongonense 05-1390]|uniref:Uncharacterized protein n=1 Tax=Mycobacterium indicus pranii (strain DSM 45239 / MTCC 9506) TaxID=1232724 RepID=J9WM58_MYCIP|nr:Hypothetical protein MIP_06539 [Mycobacterium intracellulare subsp. intracellulare MTCC 9506]AGP64798.1 hypothetical protein OEM_32630 [Mycobacterium intracellulare subsp. yongonense 05-1390]ETZ27667.1 hypothetical protein L842_4563 [Mycobacterium intracellulare MIN_052511_1280]